MNIIYNENDIKKLYWETLILNLSHIKYFVNGTSNHKSRMGKNN